MKQQNIVILGSTGSIGVNTLAVIKQYSNLYNVYGLVANSNVDLLIQQCINFKPNFVILMDKTKYSHCKDQLIKYNLNDVKLLNSEKDILDLVCSQDTDIVMSAIVGAKGLLPTYYAIKSDKKVLLANKESLIIGGKLIIEALKIVKNGQLIPVDSEHSAIFQALHVNNFNYEEVNRIILTASGGPFRNFTHEQLKLVTVDDALNHPNWKMGSKITIDSSTLMNKGLEVIEAFWLFGQNIDKIDVIIHPESIIHSMVEFIDGSIISQMGLPDMKTAIAYAINHPKRFSLDTPKLNFNTLNKLTFQEVDYNKFPCLKLAIESIKTNPDLPTIMNAANEIAVNAFLNKKIKYLDIYNVINTVMNGITTPNITLIEDIITLDMEIREKTTTIIDNLFAF
jgi:1-deoxy-D-xylulose-5-phosphate reductoisomerase